MKLLEVEGGAHAPVPHSGRCHWYCNRCPTVLLWPSNTVDVAWHPKSLCGVSQNQLTSTVIGENPGSRPRWSMHTSWMTPQSDNRALLFLDNSGLSWTVSAPDKVTAVPVRRNGNFQTPISVPVVRPKRCHTLSNPAHRQDYTVACLNYTLQTMMPLHGWPVMAPNAYDNNNNITIISSIQWQFLYVVLQHVV